jgi:hypothetical protein
MADILLIPEIKKECNILLNLIDDFNICANNENLAKIVIHVEYIKQLILITQKKLQEINILTINLLLL